ncbi:MAG: hypothetical protein J2P15_14585 [Micromonosporaceae bacterium]|nr:hypothetical protein [Micromonosporaceae bacterium]
MTIYYRDDRVVVASQWFVVDSQRFAVSEMRDLAVGRGEGDRHAIRAGLVLAALTGLIAMVGLVLHWVAVSVLVAGVGLVVVGILIWRALHARPFELWAEYRGLTVLMYRSTERQRFGQVCRALLRSAEQVRRSPQRRASDPAGDGRAALI